MIFIGEIVATPRITSKVTERYVDGAQSES